MKGKSDEARKAKARITFIMDSDYAENHTLDYILKSLSFCVYVFNIA